MSDNAGIGNYTNITKICRGCHGKGWVDGSKGPAKCPICYGEGRLANDGSPIVIPRPTVTFRAEGR